MERAEVSRQSRKRGRGGGGGGGGERFLAGCQGRVPGREATDVALLPLHHHHQPGRKCAEWAGSPYTRSHGIPGPGPAAPTSCCIFLSRLRQKKKNLH